MARFQSWEPDRMQMTFFAVTVRDEGGAVLATFETGLGGYDLDADVAWEPALASWCLDASVRHRLGIALSERPLLPRG